MASATDAGNSSGLDPATQRTGIFLAVGGLLLLLGWAVQPRFKPAEVKPAAERILFPELTDAQKAASLEIVQYDEELATLYPFKVVKSGGVWVLPSHQNYPADAKDHLAAAATELVDLKTLDVVSESPADHEVYGVIEPDREKIKPGMTGVGRLIEIRDASGSKLARLVVGKEDRQPGAAPAAAGGKLRFVRKAGQDPVYRVEIDTSKFTTKFDDWIEKDLLKLTPWDVRRVEIDNYTLAAVESAGRLRVEQQRDERMLLAYDDKGSKWMLTTLETFPKTAGGDAEPKSRSLAENEELDSAKLNDLRNALGDLKIVDVARKPSGLSADLKAEESFTKDLEAVSSLQQRGFLPLPSGEILSTEGETVVGMKDGVEYVLRFGVGTTVAESGKDEEKPGEATSEDVGTGEIAARYLLVMVRFNEDLLERPDLEDLPPLPEEKAKTEETEKTKQEDEDADAEASPPEGKQSVTDKPAPAKPDAGKPDAGKPDAGKPDAEAAAQNSEAGEEQAKPGKPDAEATDAGSGEADAPAPADATAANPDAGSPAADGPPADPESDAEQSDSDTSEAGKATDQSDGPSAAELLKQADEAEAAMQKAIEARRQVERENRRKQEAFDEKIDAGKKRVRELNGRFADWYYIVSEEEFKKIHLDRKTVITAKQQDESAEGEAVK